jgi:hypothetical protein
VSPQPSALGASIPLDPRQPAAQLEEPPFHEADDFHLAEPAFDFARFTTVAKQAAPPTAPAWRVSYSSWERRPIETVQLGTGPQRTLVISSLHGDEPLAVRMIERLADDARGNSQGWSGRTVLLVRSPNPDGLARGTRMNSRGVDLNRNFPTRTFRPDARQRTGAVAGSELETRFVLRLLYAFRPQRVVHVKSTTDAAGWVMHNRQLAGVAAQLRQTGGFQVHELRPDAIPGSLESYVTDVVGFEHITVSLPAQSDADAAWSKYRTALLTAVGVEAEQWDGPSFGQKKAKPRTGSTEPSRPGEHSDPATEPIATFDGEEGPVPSKGYFEVPPPPGYASADE